MGPSQTNPPPSLPHLSVVRFGTGEFSSKLTTKIPFAQGTVVASITNIERNVAKRWSTVQVGEDEHIELDPESGLVFMNHSCDPSVFLDTTNMQVIALKDLPAGSDVTFFYPSTEWEMAQPFKCWCGASDCVGTVSGAKDLGEQRLQKFKLNEHIKWLQLKDRK
ncbi:hypothetical protein HDV05_008399 [Chytridiales sp. JEL 0842]|nr:hypothetical protein HDV05_008399 [Chytridiales sp. JEL 0842]